MAIDVGTNLENSRENFSYTQQLHIQVLSSISNKGDLSLACTIVSACNRKKKFQF